MTGSGFFQLDNNGREFLAAQWQQLTATADAEIGQQLFATLTEYYSQPGRFYHNLSHVKALLEKSLSYRAAIDDFTAVQYAIWFHDLIYDTHKSDNEPRSAEFAARALAELGLGGAIVQKVGEMILATRTHTLKQDDSDTRIFLDLDLAILSAPPDIYQHYRQAIRQEYNWVPGFLYRINRKKILKGFLRRERLYFSAEFAELEARARANISAEIATL
jgi:predicted metal-dependent HD superfamily phosphohydrolase